MTLDATAGSTPVRGEAGRRAVVGGRAWVVAHAFPLYLATVIGSGVLLTAVMAAGLADAKVNPWAVLLGAVLCLGADRPLLEIRFGHNSTSFTWAELCVVIGLFVVPTDAFVVLAAACVLLFHLLMRRQALKAIFNAASFTIGVGFAGLVAHLV